MRSIAALAIAFLFTACSRFGGGSAQPAAGFNSQAALTFAIQDAMSDESLGQMASRKARLPETRQFGESVQREAAALRSDLAVLAQQRKLPLPAAPAEKHVALRENLDILQGQVFDRGYSLAMVQDLTATISAFDGAAAHDRELGELGARHKAALTEQLKAASATLDHAGGSPFGFVP